MEKKGQDKKCAWIHRPPSNSQVCVTARVKGEKKKTTERKEMTYCVYEKKKKREVTPPNGVLSQKSKMERMKQRAEVERSKKAQSGSVR